MKQIEFRDLEKIKYKVHESYKKKMKETKLYQMLEGDLNGDEGVIEYEGELYEVGMYVNSGVSTMVKHIKTHTMAMSDMDISEGKNPTVYTNCRWLCAKILDDWLKETNRLVEQDEKLK